MQKIFHCHSIVNDYDHGGSTYDNLVVGWFVTRRTEAVVPYEQAIINYFRLTEQNRRNCQSAVDELFTDEEAEALRVYLYDQHGGLGVDVTDASLPVPDTAVGFGALAVGGGPDFLMLDRHPQYCLTFPVWGYFDTRQHNGIPRPLAALPSEVPF